MIGSDWYPIATGVAMLVSLVVTARLFGRASRGPRGGQLAIVWSAALVGAIVGAKLAFLLAEGLAHPGDWKALVGGRSIAGALLGGYGAVELAKHWIGWTEPTGDLFAVSAPLAIAVGRLGCLAAGCCQGIECGESWWTVTDREGHARWPAPIAELAFNVAFAVWALAAQRFGWRPTQRFHIYLIAYGLFRFLHEFLRADPRWIGDVGGYHLVALALVFFGAWRYRVRARSALGASVSLESP